METRRLFTSKHNTQHCKPTICDLFVMETNHTQQTAASALPRNGLVDPSLVTELSRGDLVTLWKRAVGVPLPKAGTIHAMNASDPVKCVTVSWESQDIEANTKVTFDKTYHAVANSTGSAALVFHAPRTPPVPANPNPATKQVTSTSPSGKRRVAFHVAPDGDVRVTFHGDVDDGALDDGVNLNYSSPCLSAAAVHGSLLPSPFYQWISWSRDERTVVYVAERHVAPTPKVWDKKELDSRAPSQVSSAFEAKGNFGEAMREFSYLSIFVASEKHKRVCEIVPPSFSASHWLSNPTFVGFESTSVWFAAAPYFPERLGLAHCASRPNTLYEVSIADMFSGDCSAAQPTRIPFPAGNSSSIATVRCLRCSPDGRTVVCFAPAAGCPAHSCCNSLWQIDVASKAFEMLVPVVDLPTAGICENDDAFPGFYSCTGGDLWFLNDDTVVVQSPCRSACVVYAVRIRARTATVATHGDVAKDDLKLRRLPLHTDGGSAAVGNWSVLDVRDGYLLLSHSTAVRPPSVYLHCVVTGSTVVVDEDVASRFLTSSANAALQTEVVHIPDAHDTEVLLHRLSEDSSRDRSRRAGTVLFLHGGPHASDSNQFLPSIWFLLQCRLQVASVNYGGSTGFGQRRIDELLGNAGNNDVADCIRALEVLQERHYVADGEPVVVSGGSHGGFLTAHLSSRFPTRFVAAWLRNPVINMASMLFETDIPDWCLAEAGVSGYSQLTPQTLADRLYMQSPMPYARNVTAATLIGLGLDDLRVPIAQGRSWYTALRRWQAASGGEATDHPETRLVEYAGTGHAMDAPQATADFHLHGIMVLQRALLVTVTGGAAGTAVDDDTER